MKNLSVMLLGYQALERKSMRALSREIGIPVATFYRMTQGKPTDGKTLAKVITWALAEKKEGDTK